MPETIVQTWAKPTAELRFPGSGLLEETAGSEKRGSLGFRPGEGGACEVWHEAHSSKADWAGLIERVTTQARKAKYDRAIFIEVDNAPSELVHALADAGFTGEPLSRPLRCDAPDELQQYLDWRGRLIVTASGKGSEEINAKLYAFVADQFPAEGRYSEQEVNAILRDLHLYGDQSGLRRELIDRGLLARTKDCTQYWKVVEGDQN